MIIAVSMGADPLHVGHLDLIDAAVNYGRVVVILNSDDWLMRKKNYIFMPFDERKRILMSIRNVHRVIGVDDSDDTVCKALKLVRPDYFANGGDRTEPNEKEDMICDAIGIKQLFNVGGDKVQSSSQLVENANNGC